MHLISMDICGFKSFADKTHIEFSKGVTCIVGPNGSGKSNLVEAIKWVLGSQAPNSLRSERMSDLIFNGTKDEHGRVTREGSDFAEVSMVLSNEDGLLGPDISEIEVRRRLIRKDNGTLDSEYAINRNVCKLKDINELFYNTGIGKNAYSIMDQGKIASILSTKPEDRRYVFDEAAGISKFIQDETEARRRLDAAEENLKDVNAEYEALRKSYDTLKAQSQKAAECRKVLSEYKSLETKYMLVEYAAYHATLKRYEDSIARSKEKLKKIDEKSEKNRQAVGEERSSLESLTSDLIKAESILAGYREALVAKRSSLDEARRHHEALEGYAGNMLDGMKAAEREEKDCGVRLEKLKSETEALSLGLKAAESDLRKNDDAAAETAARSSQLSAEISGAENEKAEIDSELTALYAEFTERSRKIVETANSVFPEGFDADGFKGAMEELRVILDDMEMSFRRVIGGGASKEEHIARINRAVTLYSVVLSGIPDYGSFHFDRHEMELSSQTDKRISEKLESAEKLRKKSESLRVDFAKVSAKARELSVEREKIIGSIGDANVRLKVNESNLESLREQAVAIAGRRAAVREEYDRRKAEADAGASRKKEIEKDISDYEKKISSAEKGVEVLKAKMEKVKAAIHKLDAAADVAEVTSINLHIADLNGRMSGVNDNIRRLQDDFFENYGKKIEDEDISRYVGMSDADKSALKAKVTELGRQYRGFSGVNWAAEEQFEDVKKQYDFITAQVGDYTKARDDLKGVVDEIKSRSREQFISAFGKLRENFAEMFSHLFSGGKASLELSDDSDVLSSGIEIIAEPPGKAPHYLQMLSGGEKNMTTIALLFALYKVKPSPFCVVDEIDDNLDARNTGRFLTMLDEFIDTTQFVIVSHKRDTIMRADALLGVTQMERGISKIFGYKVEGDDETNMVFRDTVTGRKVELNLDGDN